MSNLIGQSKYGSIMLLDNFGAIKEENDEGSNAPSKKQSTIDNNMKNSELELGGGYIGEDDEEEKPKEEDERNA